MNKTTTVLCVAAAVALLSGCESARKVFSNEKTGPDEFAVYSRPPLSLPPDYRLRPPAPGERRPDDLSAKTIAQQAIIRNQRRSSAAARPPEGSSVGIQALLRETGGIAATSDIRVIINEETSILAEQDQAFVDRLIFWVDDKPFEGTVVDAEKEQKRIRENQALGKPITEGDTPQVKRKRGRKGLLEF